MAEHAATGSSGSEPERTLVIRRVFDAPREDVFAAWVDPEQMSRWMGPRNIAAEVDRMDVRPGGAYRIKMRDVATGDTYAVGGIYREIVWPERLVFTWAWEEDALQHKRGEVTVVTLALRAVGAKTELTLHHAGFPRQAMRDNHGLGWTASFDKLAELLSR